MYNTDQFIIDLNKKKETAWKHLYQEFYPALCVYAEKITHESGAVEDLVQESIIGLWESSLHFADVKSLACYLYKSVYTRALNLIRDRENARKCLSNYVAEQVYSEEIAIELAIEENVIAKLRMVLSTLSDQQKQIMDLTLSGLKVKEIAQILDVSENTIKMQKKRAYSIVRERMGVVWGFWLLSFFSEFL